MDQKVTKEDDSSTRLFTSGVNPTKLASESPETFSQLENTEKICSIHCPHSDVQQKISQVISIWLPKAAKNTTADKAGGALRHNLLV